jgi:predicted RNA-binding Zn-ribbon protein involved in translation (DUF1610 family)
MLAALDCAFPVYLVKRSDYKNAVQASSATDEGASELNAEQVPKFCSGCGAAIPATGQPSKYCPECGNSLLAIVQSVPEERKSNRILVLVGSFIIFILLCALMADRSLLKVAPGGWASLFGSPPVVTIAEYERIQEGMTYDQVSAIIGEAGEEISRSDIAGYRTVMYAWKNSNGSNMNAMLQNGRLITKAQFGLP